jgi:membrane protease YdiL (CAAX protease family)
MSETADIPTEKWSFPDHDAFSRMEHEHRLPFIRALPGMVVWPILLFVLAFGFSFVTAVVTGVFLPDIGPANFNTAIFASSAAAYGALALLMAIWFHRYKAAGPAFSIIPVRPSEIAAGLLVLIFVIFVGGRLSVMFHEFAMLDQSMTLSGGVDIEEISNVDDFGMTGAAFWSVLLLTVIAAPIVEEVLFRGWMLPMIIARGVPVIFAILISALAFSLIHTSQGLLVMSSTFFLGIALGLARVLTGRVAAPVLGHMANNAWAVFAVPALMQS